MKGAIFLRRIKRAILPSISAILFAAGMITPVRGIVPAVAIADDALLKVEESEPPSSRVIEVIVTAYSSSPDETDYTPHITAFGTEARDGVIANNCLPFKTEVQIPEVFGDKIFTVEDRKNARYSCKWVDVWYPSKEEAKKFGIVRGVEMVVFD